VIKSANRVVTSFRDWRRRRSEPCTVSLAFDGGYARRIRKGPRRNFEILTGAGEIDGKIWVFASAHKAVSRLKRRLAAFVDRLRITSEQPIALMTDGAESLLRLKALLPVPTRFVLDYFQSPHERGRAPTILAGCSAATTTDVDG
jgi:hypothetical protein